MTVYTWSQTAASNNSADATINWTEGQAPSSVNDSARAMMAAVAKYRDDNSGSLTTGGSSTAYTLSSNQAFASLATMNGQSLRVKFNATNDASPTLNVDSLGAKSIVTVSGSAVGAGQIVANSVHSLVYDNSNNCFVIISSPQPFPSGTKMLFQQTAAPTGWTKDTSHNNKALRIVSGTASSGGSTAFTSVFTSRTIAQVNLPAVNFTGTLPDHQHTIAVFQSPISYQPTSGGPETPLSYGAGATNKQTAAGTTSATSISVSSGGSGTALDFAVQYVDVIIATKD